jgi:glycerate kinase
LAWARRFWLPKRKGARRIILGIGGSATNDGGFGLARALGWKFLNRDGNEIFAWPALTELQKVQPPSKRLPKGLLTVAVDVKNPLLGPRGATRIYGPQKGIRPQDVLTAERCLRRLALVMKRQFGSDFAKTPGAGAAGGLGFGLATFANARLVSGFDLFARQAGLNRLLAKVDLIITAEGSLDVSTLMGKGAGQIALLGKARKIPVLGLAGLVRDPKALRKMFAATHALVELTTPENARKRAGSWLERLALRIATNMQGQKLESGLASGRCVAKLAM